MKCHVLTKEKTSPCLRDLFNLTQDQAGPPFGHPSPYPEKGKNCTGHAASQPPKGGASLLFNSHSNRNVVLPSGS